MAVPRQICRWHVYASLSALQEDAARMILQSAEKAIREKGNFSIVLAGGGTPKGLYERLAFEAAAWNCWEIYFGDERCLPVDHPDRNSVMASNSWLSHVSIPKENIHVIPAELGPEEGALRYSNTLKIIEEFDFVLLGLGEDGHTASLFPGRTWENRDVLPVCDAPKPPPERISLSPSRLSASHRVCFLVAGESKRRAVSEWKSGKPMPASFIVPSSGVDIFIESSAIE